MKSYFDPADTMKPGEFARGILDHYPIKDTKCDFPSPADEASCNGQTPEGHSVTVVAYPDSPFTAMPWS
jgi:hypothetical protein